ncbi:DEP domain-containing protein 5 [Biomphalaria pfeifferi]|uniref:DEP domain-containing protein 5 n=1 Tax=Biomphalaria pfeifferi TaxID=112525 RepID=A0AAD8BSK4_BIOPF|nr:DEP domain-containing protein 5 [Biomphalaria pfeifferi]
MKTFKLLFHTSKSPKNQDILISAKDFPDVRVCDVLEVYHPEDEWNRVLLQVKSLPDDSQQKETVIIEPAIANAFSLRQYHNVVVNKVETETVRLDLVELLFKELYFGRSDMWRLCKALTNTCVYLKKQIDFVEKRVHINELWARGDNVTCGVITEDTRFVFRSPTAVVQIFIQMSTEMWDFDLHGDLYLEKAVNGFLTDLFDKWKEQNCVHDVTIVLFSRTFYDAKSIDEFPPAIRECLFIDYKGRIYEDYYRVIVQNERYEEWQSVLRQIRTLCNCYRDLVLNYHKERFPEWKMPNASLSVAAQGNFLETLNMSLNLFENYYMDRNFDRTGKVSVVVTPGPGVFEVDRQLANITKQRTIDCGVGSDLVCMGEQPLHAAPLFKFHSKMTHMSIEVGDDYNIPHWMNHSFYMSKPQIHEHTTYAFVPRIKPPPALMKELEDMQGFSLKSCFSPRESSDDNIPFVDYDEYDAQVFKLPSGMASRNTVRLKRGASSRSSGRGTIPKTFEEARQRLKPRDRHQSDDVSVYFCDHPPSSPPITIPSARSSFEDMSFFFGREASKSSYESSENDELLLQRPVVGSAGSPVGHSRHLQNYRPHRALINPFAPSRLQFKMTSNRRRWAHAFPVDQKGMAMQARHIHSVEHNEQENDFPWSEKGMVKSPVITVTTSLKKQNLRQDSSEPGHAGESVSESPLSRSDHGTSSNVRRNIMDSNLRRQQSSKSTLSNKIQIFGSSKGGEQEWSSDMTTEVCLSESNQSLKEECLNESNQSLKEVCLSESNQSLKEECLNESNQSLKEVCQSESNQSLKEVCQSESNQSLKEGCLSESNQSLKEVCLNESNQSLKEEYLNESNQSLKEVCLSESNQSLKEECLNESNQSLKEVCQSESNQSLKEVCQSESNQSLKEGCLSESNQSLKEVCLNESNQSLKEECLNESNQSLKEVCLSESNQSLKEECLNESNQSLKEVCQSESNQSLKEVCLSESN